MLQIEFANDVDAIGINVFFNIVVHITHDYKISKTSGIINPARFNHDAVTKWKHFKRHWPFVRTKASDAELWCFL